MPEFGYGPLQYQRNLGARRNVNRVQVLLKLGKHTFLGDHQYSFPDLLNQFGHQNTASRVLPSPTASAIKILV